VADLGRPKEGVVVLLLFWRREAKPRFLLIFFQAEFCVDCLNKNEGFCLVDVCENLKCV